MDIVIGIVFWGGLLWLTLAWLTRVGKSEPARRAPSTGHGDGRSTGSPVGPAAAGQRLPNEHRLREGEALVDGLVIGHFLTRDHYERRIGELEDSIDELGHARDPWIDDLAVGDDGFEHGTDYAEFDAMGGFGVEPWADDLFDMEDED